MTTEELKQILQDHAEWLQDNTKGKKATLCRADLRHADLSGADLSGADLRGADLSEAKLSGADLSGANLRGADLSMAKLREAKLSRADLSEANLRGANLSEAKLSGADLSGANLRGADLSMADGICVFNKPKGRICYAVRFEHGFMIQAGCFWNTLEIFQNACLEKYGDDKTQNYALQCGYLRALSEKQISVEPAF